MIIKQTGNAAETAGVLRSLDIGISKNPKAQLKILNILTDTLYSDKIAAVWREYGCNAVDANVEAGRGDQPIEITLPTTILAEARIRDFGKGMTEYQMEHTYSMAGETTKDESNDFIGFMGIGSKAGYAYGDQFTVTSYQKGRRVVYNCFREQGILRMVKLHEGPTDEVDGMEIKVPVRRPDIDEFVKRAERVFRYFKVKPIVKGGTLDYRREKPIVSGDGWRFTGDDKSVVVMGNIGYDLDSSNLPSDFPANKKALVNSGVEIDVEIGAVEIAANREGLQYKDDTLKIISAKLGKVISELGQKFSDEIKTAPSYWHACRTYANMFERSGGSYGHAVRDSLTGTIVWRGIKVNSGSIELCRTYGKLPDGVSCTRYYKRSWGRRMSKEISPYEIHCRDSHIIVICDTPTKKIMNSRIHYWFEQNPDHSTLYVFTFENAKVQADYFKDRRLEGAPMMSMMSMPKRPVVPGMTNGTPSAHRSKHQASVVKLDYNTTTNYGDPLSVWWKPATVDKTKRIVYVNIDRFCADVGKYGNMCPSSLSRCVKAFTDIGLLTEPVYGIKSKMKTKGAQWVHLKDVVNTKLEDKWKTEPDLAQKIADHTAAHNYAPLFPYKAEPLLPKGSAAHELLTTYWKMLDPNAKRLAAFRQLYAAHSEDFKFAALPKPTEDLKLRESKVIDSYPMLHFAQHSIRGDVKDKGVQRAIDYITLIEAVRNQKAVNKV
jgi:Histidine kinase-, DNA gyrase B-, and HSP90-like ATPase